MSTTPPRRNRKLACRMGARFGVFVAAIIGFAASGCTTGYAPQRDDAGAESEAGTDVASSDAGPEEDAADEPTDGEDGRGGTETGTPPDGEGNTCVPSDPSTITRDEVPLRAGLKGTYRVAHDVEVDTKGSTQNGGRTWNYDKEYSGDHAELIELRSVEGTWYRPDFPEADYAMKLAGDSEELGLFEITDEELLMHGIVSPEEGATTTNIEYDPPVTILDFPLEEGKTWQSETDASGTHKASGYTPLTYNAIYSSEVDAAGTLQTPYGEFDVLRMRTKLERETSFGGVTFGTVRTFAFVAECFGTVATIRSKQGENDKEFDEAAEIRRLSK